MRQGSAVKTARAVQGTDEDSPDLTNGMGSSLSAASAKSGHAFFRVCWYGANGLFILSVLLAVYSAVWEYSTRRYLKGFSDAVVPQSSSAQEKVEAILNWMSHGPARQEAGPVISSPDRNPTDTLNYASLLRVCGSATNAFVNLADSAGLSARRLLLLDSRGLTKHVVAEVLVDGRWILVDPAFRTILQGQDGHLLTRTELADPTVFAAATRNIHGYDPSYTFETTRHVHLARLGAFGRILQRILDRSFPGWEDSTAISLILERESLAAVVITLVLVALIVLFRVGLRWYGERYLGLRLARARQRLRRAFEALGTQQISSRREVG